MKRFGWLMLTAALLCNGAASAEDKVLKIYNWSDYIDPQILKDFTAKTGIRVIYDVYDSNDILETKLLAGHTGYDLVVPTSTYLARQIKAGVFMKLDKSKIPNLKNLDPKIMAQVAKADPGNEHAIDYTWGTSGIAYNIDEIKKRMPDAPVDSWRMLLDPTVVSKFADCGVYMLDASDEATAAALNYINLNPDSKKSADIKKAGEVLKAVRPSIRKFNSSEDINALANGDICLAMIWSGDAGIAKTRAEEAKNRVKIQYVIPKEGALRWFDTMAIPADAPDPDNALAFMNYLLNPEIIAKVSNAVTYANGVPASLPFIDEAVKNDPGTFPPPNVLDRLYVLTPNDQQVQRVLTRMWTSVKTGG